MIYNKKRKMALCYLILSLMLGVISSYHIYAASKDNKLSQSSSSASLLKINKIYWGIHPYCWSTYPISLSRGIIFNTLYAQELWKHGLHIDFINSMKDDEVLVIIPCGPSLTMDRLKKHANNILGKRCIVIDDCNLTESWYQGQSGSIREILDNYEAKSKNLLKQYFINSGRQKDSDHFIQEIKKDIIEICNKIGFNWDKDALEILALAHILSHDILLEFEKRGFIFDPNNVESVAFGEGFEACAMNIKSMLPHYMGLSKPIESDYELSVSSAPFLINAKFKERISIGNNVRLFLWEGEDGRPIALFAQAQGYISDPQLYINLKIEGFSLEIKNSVGIDIWAHRTKYENGLLKVGIYTGTRRSNSSLEDYPYYIIANGISFNEFRDRLIKAEIGSSNTGFRTNYMIANYNENELSPDISSRSLVKINKIYWCIFPYRDTLNALGGSQNDAIIAREVKSNRLYMDLISNIKEDEVIIIIPSEATLQMDRLLEHAKRILGNRCIVISDSSPGSSWYQGQSDSIRDILDNYDNLNKNQLIQYIINSGSQKDVESISKEIKDELKEICNKIGDNWSKDVLGLMSASRILSQRVLLEFKKRGLTHDPQTVESVSFGQRYEFGAMNIKSMLPHYMGLSKPIESDYELSVSSASFLINAKFKERISIGDNVRLFLWEGEDGRPIALFAQAQGYISDPQLYINLKIEGFSLEIKNSVGIDIWAHRTKYENGLLKIGIYTATRRGNSSLEDYPYYIIANGISFNEFRDRLIKAEIGSSNTGFRTTFNTAEK